MELKAKAVGHYLIIKEVGPKNVKTAGGLELTESHQKEIRFKKAEVLSVGSEIDSLLKVGNIVSYDKNHGSKLEDGENIFLVITARDVVAIW